MTILIYQPSAEFFNLIWLFISIAVALPAWGGRQQFKTMNHYNNNSQTSCIKYQIKKKVHKNGLFPPYPGLISAAKNHPE